MTNTFNFNKLDRVTLNEYSVIIAEQISSSANKEVYKVIFNLQDKTQNMLKIIYGDDMEAKNTIDFYMNDKHNYFMEIMDYHKDGNKTFLLLKYYENHTLYEQAPQSTDVQKDHYIRSILEIGCFLHQKNYLHADIKPDNFFLDGEQVRLGDLESMIKLQNLQHGRVDTLCGTKGFKYSTNDSYTLQDEMFAYVATIYYLEMEELLLTEDDINALDLTHDPITTINNAAREYIDYINRDGIRTLLLETLDKIESEQAVDCCTLFKSYKALAEETPGESEIEQPEVKKKEQFPHEIPKKASKTKKPKIVLHKKVLAVAGTALLGWGAITLFYPTINTLTAPVCEKAYLLEHGGASIIKTFSKDGDIKYYTISKDFNFIPLDNTAALSLTNVKGEEAVCKGGKLKLGEE